MQLDIKDSEGNSCFELATDPAIGECLAKYRDQLQKLRVALGYDKPQPKAALSLDELLAHARLNTTASGSSECPF